MAKWLTFYFNHVGGGGNFSTFKFDPIFNVLLYLFETDQTAYISTLYNNDLYYISQFKR